MDEQRTDIYAAPESNIPAADFTINFNKIYDLDVVPEDVFRNHKGDTVYFIQQLQRIGAPPPLHLIHSCHIISTAFQHTSLAITTVDLLVESHEAGDDTLSYKISTAVQQWSKSNHDNIELLYILFSNILASPLSQKLKLTEQETTSRILRYAAYMEKDKVSQ